MHMTGADVCDGRKPKNARSKRVLQAREAKEVEDPRTAIFVKGTHAGERVNAVMKELVRVFLSLSSLLVYLSTGISGNADGAETAQRDLLFEKERGAPV